MTFDLRDPRSPPFRPARSSAHDDTTTIGHLALSPWRLAQTVEDARKDLWHGASYKQDGVSEQNIKILVEHQCFTPTRLPNANINSSTSEGIENDVRTHSHTPLTIVPGDSSGTSQQCKCLLVSEMITPIDRLGVTTAVPPGI